MVKIEADGRFRGIAGGGTRTNRGQPSSWAPPRSYAWTELGWPRMRAAHEVLAIDANKIACGWDGSPIDDGMVLEDLVVADGLL